MTSEVAILNKEAVALAADSAVTIGGMTGQKVFPSAQKIFPLSLRYPVGVMIYNHSTLVGVPWETIITAYRQQTGDQAFDTLRDHAQDFLSFVRENRTLFSTKQQDQYLTWWVSQLFAAIRQEIDTQLGPSAGSQGSDGSSEELTTLPIFREVIGSWEQRLRGAPINPVFSSVEQGIEVLAPFQDEVASIVESVFTGFQLDEDDRNRLASLLVDLVVRDSDFAMQESTGVVVAGFGRNDLFPSLQHYLFEGVVGGVVRYQEKDYIDVDFASPSRIVPFAQRDGAELFLEGIDPRLRERESDSLEAMLDKFALRLVQGIVDPDEVPTVRERLSHLTTETLEEYHKEMAGVRLRELTMPVLNVMAAVPKDELGEIAEHLVTLTAIRRRISFDPESVGGPIDVAVISKTDGFVWMKRKHYFDYSINPYHPRSDVEEVLMLLRGRGERER